MQKRFSTNALIDTNQLQILFLLLYLISLPLILEAPIVLKWWLGIVPEHTINFLRIILCTSLVVSLSNPLVISIYATGVIKNFKS